MHRVSDLGLRGPGGLVSRLSTGLNRLRGSRARLQPANMTRWEGGNGS